MNLISTIVALAAAVFLLAAPVSGRAGDDLLPIVFEDYPPYEYVEDGEVKGINVDIIREAFRRMGIKPFFEPRPWKRALFDLEHGDIQALSSGFKTEERERFAYFSEPLAMENNVVLAMTVSGVEIRSLEDLRGLRVGVVRAYVYGHGFEETDGLNKVQANSSHQLLRMLFEQRMDVAVGNLAVFRHLAAKMGKLSQIKPVFEIGSDPLYLMFSRNHGAKTRKLADEFGRTVREMRRDGTFKAIQDKY